MRGIFSRFRNPLSRQSALTFPPLAPEEEFTAVGDIHGRYDLMQRLMDHLARRSNLRRLVFLGDYIDRGEQSAEVLKGLHWLSSNSGGVICLRGNHEDMLLGFLEDPLRHGPAWLQHGGRQTLLSFGVAPAYSGAPEADWLAARNSLQSKMGADLIAWLRALPVIWQSGNVATVHAGADPSRPMDAQNDQDLIWGHPNFLRMPRRDGVWVLHGHTIVEDVAADQGRIGVDTGAFATGRLSAVTVTSGGYTVLTA